EIQNKLLIIKKKAKHKKHKSGKKSVSKKAITKKRKTVTKSPTVPEFQLICTNLDELRELITKIENELKDLENSRKKSVSNVPSISRLPTPFPCHTPASVMLVLSYPSQITVAEYSSLVVRENGIIGGKL
ncbi:KIAA2026 isoform 5, partial [Pongo abelii]